MNVPDAVSVDLISWRVMVVVVRVKGFQVVEDTRDV